MPTSKQKNSNKKRKPTAAYSKKQEKVQKQQKIITRCGIVAGAIVLIVWIVNSSFWPWPTRDEMDRRLNETIDLCMYNETSYACSSAQKKYGLKFEYCHSLSDIPEIDKSIPVYGVARKSDYDMKATGPYYSCAHYIEDVDRSNTEDFLKTEPTTVALWSLYSAPKINQEGDGWNWCRSYWTGHIITDFWDNIPNYKAIENEYKIASDTYIKCSQSDNLAREYDRINKKIDKYVSNKTVQLYFKYYDDPDYFKPKTEEKDSLSSVGGLVGCTYTWKESSFIKSLDNCLEENSLPNFARRMRSKMSAYEYTSKTAEQ